MSDNELELVYKINLTTSHFAGLRGVFDAGYAAGAGLTASQAQSADNSTIVSDATMASDVDPNITTP
jgi:hypothetical protein